MGSTSGTVDRKMRTDRKPHGIQRFDAWSFQLLGLRTLLTSGCLIRSRYLSDAGGSWVRGFALVAARSWKKQ